MSDYFISFLHGKYTLVYLFLGLYIMLSGEVIGRKETGSWKRRNGVCSLYIEKNSGVGEFGQIVI